MHTVMRYSDVIGTAVGGLGLAAANTLASVHPAFWAVWAASGATVAGARIYLYRLTRP